LSGPAPHTAEEATQRELLWASVRLLVMLLALVFVVVPLLLETGACMDLVQRVLVVDCDEAEQVRRVAESRGFAPEDVRRIMATQLPRAERLRRADDVLHNDGSIEALRGQVEQLHARYVALARQAAAGPADSRSPQ